MSIPKKHHFVPELLLRNFTDSKGELWYLDKSKKYKSIVPRPPGSVFHREFFYSVKDPSGELNHDAEFELGRMETATGHVMLKIIAAVRSGEIPKLTLSEKEQWCKFVYLQFKRTPEAISRVLNDDNVKEWVEDAIKELEDKLGVQAAAEEVAKLFEKDRLRDFVKETGVKGALHPGKDAIPILMKMGLWFARTTNPKKAYIIGSRPVVRLHNSKSARLGDEGVQLWLPIASDIAVGFIQDYGEQITPEIPASDIRKLNMAIWFQSQQVASRSRDLMISLDNACN